MNALAAFGLGRLTRHPDLVAAVAVLILTAMLVVPVPGWLLDLLIPVNLMLSVTLLVSAMLVKKVLDLSSFPSFLLVSTLFRLALNLSSTRGILTKADAGHLVTAFGKFVVQGDLLIGAVMFGVITLVQFMVIAKGAERVAEVGARFTLDAMPGKQMSIDAAVRNGAITDEEGQFRREELGRASTLLGALDGAMKFVKGDAIAGLIITAINVVAGVAIGVLRANMPAGEALELYATLTIGDALVAQVSALVITLAAGLLVTRVDPRDARHAIGDVLKLELFSNPKVLAVASGSMFLMGLAPGLPMLPFFLAGAVGAAWASRVAFFPQRANDPRDPQAALQHNLQNRVEAAKKQKALSDQLAPTVVPITVDLGPGLSAALGFGNPGEDPALVRDYVPQLRDALYCDTGVRFPGVRFRPSAPGVAEHAFVVRIDDVPVLEERLLPDRSLATATPEQLKKLGIEAEPQRHPISGATMALIASSDKALASAAGITVWEAPGLVSLSLAAVLRRRAANFLGIQEVSDLVERLEKAYPALVKEVVPKITTLPQLLGVLRRLVDEGVSIRNLRAIIEALSEHGTRDGDPVWLTEKVRAALGAQLAHSYAGLGHSLPVVLLDPLLEDTVRAGICTTADGHTLALEPEVAKEVVISVVRSLEPMLARGKRPIILTQTPLRRFVRKLLEVDLPAVAVLGFDELPADLSIQPMGRACLPG